MAIEFKPPAKPNLDGKKSVFLAGTIDSGQSIDWQSTVAPLFADATIAILNPRRDEWDASWVQSIENEPFREQVNWELDGLERADVVLMHFAAASQSPITLLELGLTASSAKVIISCAPNFWRRGNIEVVADRYNIPLYQTLEEASEEVKRRLS